MIPEVPAENTMPTALAKRVFGDTSFGKWIPFLWRAARGKGPPRTRTSKILGRAKHGQTWPNTQQSLHFSKCIQKVSQGSCFEVEFLGYNCVRCVLVCVRNRQPWATLTQPSTPSTRHGEISCFLVPIYAGCSASVTYKTVPSKCCLCSKRVWIMTQA
jgi:hypothetical protein